MAILFEMTEEFRENLENQGIVFEEKSAVLAELKLRYGKDVRKIVSIQMKADAAFRKGNYKDAIKLYNEYLDGCNTLKKYANEIPEVNIKDYVQLLIPVYNGFIAGSMFGYATSNKLVFKNDSTFKDSPKSYAKGLVDNYIKYGKMMISECKKKMKNKGV